MCEYDVIVDAMSFAHYCRMASNHGTDKRRLRSGLSVVLDFRKVPQEGLCKAVGGCGRLSAASQVLPKGFTCRKTEFGSIAANIC